MPAVLKLNNVKRKPLLIDIIPGVGRDTGTTIYPYVFLGRLIYKDAFGANPNPYTVGLILHEQEHLTRMKRYGVVKWYFHYLFSPTFRLEEELGAYALQFAHIKHAGLTVNLATIARFLSSWLYLWVGSYKDVLKRLDEIWESS
jgi:hypothetical protein